MARIIPLKTTLGIVMLTAVAGLYGCPVHDGVTTAGTGGTGGTGALSLTGTTTLGPLNGSNITVFQVNADGSNGKQIGSGVTNNDGTFKITLTEKPTGPFRVCSADGAYTDESTGTGKTNQVKDFCALVPLNAADVNVNPLTAFIDALTKGQIKKTANPKPADLQNAVTAAQNKIQKFFALKNPPHTVKPTFAAPPTGAAPTDGYLLAALLGAYSQLEKDNGQRCGGTVAQDRLNALIADITDGVFDGKTINPLNAAETIALQVACAAAPGGKENLPVGTGTADLLNAYDEFGNTQLGQTMQVNQQTGARDAVRTAVATGDLAPPQVNVVASQGLIAIDTANKVAYVPIYTWDANSNARIAVVDLANTPTDPTKIPTISLPGSQQPIASSFDPVNHKVYVEARKGFNGSDGVFVYVIDPSTRTVLQTIDASPNGGGLSHSGTFGGIIANPTKNKVIVVGTNDLGIIRLDPQTGAPTFDVNSVISLFGTDSIALNFDTEILFVSDDGSNQLVNTSTAVPSLISFPAAGGTTDGVAFDNLTNVVAQSAEVGSDLTHIFNFNSLQIAGTAPGQSATALLITINGTGNSPNTGEGPGGQAAVNVLTHQAVAIDEFGENFKLLQLPTSQFTGAPVAATTGTGAAFQISAGVIPQASIGGTPTTLGMRGDPNSLSIDPVGNKMYALADPNVYYNGWPANDTRPLFLVEVDLAHPVQGASPTAVDAHNNPLRWTPQSRLIRLP
ncbi:MAG: hypothetical protein E6R07_01845 [Nevskiaceae bacterium]|nr:MAG: hypothetical protein E6R07_01845 [Nevskiaceae bacterium]